MSETPSFYAQELARLAAQMPLQHYQYLQIRQSRAFIEQHYAQPIELSDMAAAAAMSRFHYLRIFQQIYGITPRHYLRDLRLSKARALLQQGLPVTQVCLAVGYSSLPSFSQAFKRGTGHAPQAYQKRHLRNRE
ncbi:MAG: helix-turn-helix domain-containing protein [Candidatus Sericytochromatia bacterium]